MRQDLELTCAACGQVNHLTIVGARPTFTVSCSRCGTDLKIDGRAEKT